MSHTEQLRANLHQAIDSAPADVLEQINALLNPAVEYLSPAMEERIGQALAEIEAGQFYTLEEFNLLAEEQDKARREKYGF